MLTLSLITAFVAVAVTVFIVWTFVKHYKQKALWVSLGICLVLVVAGILLYHFFLLGVYLALPVLGLVVLLITCLVVMFKEKSTLVPENANLLEQVLRKSWWKMEDTPPQEVDNAQLVA